MSGDKLMQASDVYDGLRLRTFDDGVNVGDVYDGLRLRISGEGINVGDRSS